MIDVDHPAGNGRLRHEDGKLLIDRDLRDSSGDRWYWHVRVGQGPAVDVDLARPGLLGGYGPAISTDGGRTFSWLWSRYQRDCHSFRLSATPRPVVMCSTLPYSATNLVSFTSELGGEARVGRLARSEAGRDVPLIHLAARTRKHRLVVAARHHACEAMGSRVLEGMLLSLLELRRAGMRWARNTEVLAVPMVDIDGVERGDQGKGRLPRDHNRDYGASSRYAAVRAIRAAGLFDDVPTVTLDLHTPGLIGPLEERPFLIASGDRGDAQTIAAYAAGIDGGSGTAPEVMTFPEPWNSVSSTGPRCFVAWARSHPKVVLGASVEYPNAALRETPVSPGSARSFGRQLVAALEQVFD